MSYVKYLCILTMRRLTNESSDVRITFDAFETLIDMVRITRPIQDDSTGITIKKKYIEMVEIYNTIHGLSRINPKINYGDYSRRVYYFLHRPIDVKRDDDFTLSVSELLYLILKNLVLNNRFKDGYKPELYDHYPNMCITFGEYCEMVENIIPWKYGDPICIYEWLYDIMQIKHKSVQLYTFEALSLMPCVIDYDSYVGPSLMYKKSYVKLDDVKPIKKPHNVTWNQDIPFKTYKPHIRKTNVKRRKSRVTDTHTDIPSESNVINISLPEPPKQVYIDISPLESNVINISLPDWVHTYTGISEPKNIYHFDYINILGNEHEEHEKKDVEKKSDEGLYKFHLV